MAKKSKKRKRRGDWWILAVAGADVYFMSKDTELVRIPLGVCLGLRDGRALDVTLEQKDDGDIRFIRSGEEIAVVPKALGPLLLDLLESWEGNA